MSECGRLKVNKKLTTKSARRFALLSSETSGPRMKIDLSEKDACKAILRSVAKKHRMQIEQGEAQLGRTKVFIRAPETYFELERLRITIIEKHVMKIQRMMRKVS